MADATSTTATTAANVPHELSAEKMMMDNLLILGLIFFIFYFILIRPQQKRLKAHREMIRDLKKGDKVITGGGIIGTLAGFDGDTIAMVEIAPGVKIRVARDSISDVVEDKSPGKSANDN